MSSRRKLRSFVDLARLKFLVYSPMMYTIGAAVGFLSASATFSASRYAIGLVFGYLAQISNHFFNEYYDYEYDALNVQASPWTGGSRVLTAGRLVRRDSLRAGILAITLAVALLALMPSSSAKITCVAIAFMAWAYSGSPVAFERRGMGELTVVIVLDALVPMLGAQLQGGSGVEPMLICILVPLGIVQYLRMTVMNMADVEPDRLSGKTTLVVILGRARAIRIHRVGTALAYLAAFPLLIFGLPVSVALLFLCTAPLAAWVSLRLDDSAWATDNPFWSTQHNGLCIAVALLGLFFASPRVLSGAGLIMLYPYVVLALVLPRTVATAIRVVLGSVEAEQPSSG